MVERIAFTLFKLRNRHFFLLDVAAFLIIPSLALMLRIDGTAVARYGDSLLVVTATFAFLKMVLFYVMSLYGHYWRYASIDELALISLASLLATFLQTVVFMGVLRPLELISLSFPRSIPLIDGLLTLIIVGGTRYSVRLAERLRQRRSGRENAKRVLVMGAGEAGIMITREMQRNPDAGLHPVAFVDDDVQKQHSRIQGISVMGGRADIPRLVRELRIGRVIIAMPSALGSEIREIVGICDEAGVRAKIIPGITELLDGRVQVSQLRDVDIEDLLRREPVRTDIGAVRELIASKRVLVTGGGGSIGGELCRQVLHCRPSKLIVLGHGENSVFEIYHELASLKPAETVLTPVVADTRFPERLERIFEEHRPQIIFHAAAHKHVPLMEMYPAEAILNNVIGTRNLLSAALDSAVEHFVMISTDKAVNPTGVMGASKRVAELLVHQAAERSGRPYVAVRFGNVLGSRGSVVHTFRRQIAAGGPVTVTDPEMARYFMTIPEAVQLVLQAAVLGEGGELFVLDMGEPVKILDLARDLISLSGFEVGREIEIKIIGARPGEKLFEELFVPGEQYQRTRHEKIFIAANASSLVPDDLDAAVGALYKSAQRDDHDAMMRGLCNLVPEFRPILSEAMEGSSPGQIRPVPMATPAGRAQPGESLSPAG